MMRKFGFAVLVILLPGAVGAAPLTVSDPNAVIVENKSVYLNTQKEYDVFYNVTFEFERIPGECFISFQLPAVPRDFYKDTGLPHGAQGRIPAWDHGVPGGFLFSGKRVLVQDCSGDPVPGESPKTAQFTVRYFAK